MKKALLLTAVVASTAVAPAFAKTVKSGNGRSVSDIRQALKKGRSRPDNGNRGHFAKLNNVKNLSNRAKSRNFAH